MSIASELEALKNKDGLIVAEDVVDWARAHPKSALYNAPQFCGWDERKSARRHWIWGARTLIAIHLQTKEGQRRVFSLSPDRLRPGGGYRDIDDILRDETLYNTLISDAMAELERMRRKYEHVMELKPVWKATARVAKDMARRTRRTRPEAAA